MNKLWYAMAFVSSLTVYACSALNETAGPKTASAESSTPSPSSATLVGEDRDAHGCIASAGYQWCERTSRCERSWELAKQEGFSLDADGFKGFCSAPRAP